MASIEKNKKIQPEGIGTRLRGLRTKEKMSVRKFAETYGLNYPLWNNYENDKRKPNATTIEKLCKIFGVTPNWIIFGDPAQQSQSPAQNQAAGGDDVPRRKGSKVFIEAVKDSIGKGKK